MDATASAVRIPTKSEKPVPTRPAIGIKPKKLSPKTAETRPRNSGGACSNTIVQEHAPPELRGRVSAVFGLSFFGLMPIAGLVVTGFSDLVGMRTALAVASVIYGIAAFAVLSLAGRHVCDRPISPTPEPELTPVA